MSKLIEELQHTIKKFELENQWLKTENDKMQSQQQQRVLKKEKRKARREKKRKKRTKNVQSKKAQKH